MPAEMEIDRLRDEVERLTKLNAELVGALENIRLTAHSEAPAEELVDAQWDLRHIYAISDAALALAKGKP